LALVGTLCLADFADAQIFRRGRGGYYGGGYGNGYYGNQNYGNQNWNAWNDGYNRSFYPPDSFDDDQFNQGNRQGDNQRAEQRDRQNQAHVLVRVPSPDAQVWFDDHRTQQGGMQRMFDSPPLQSGTYSYNIRAKWRQDGKDMEQTRTVRVQPGQRVTVDFARSNTGRQGEQIAPPRRNNQNDQYQDQSNENQPRQNPNPPRQKQQSNPNPD